MNENTGMDTFDIEYTDTFVGQANYSWVQRSSFTLPKAISDDLIKRIAKEIMGLSGVRGIWEDMADGYVFKPYNSCTILFITFREDN
jgi:hypothetical protein